MVDIDGTLSRELCILLSGLHEDVGILVCSARPEVRRRDTSEYLRALGLRPDVLRLRGGSDPADVAAYKLQVAREWDPDLVVDDDFRVERILRRNGFPVLQISAVRQSRPDRHPIS